MILAYKNETFYQDYEEFWQQKEPNQFFESKFNRKFDIEEDEENQELIIEYFEQKDGIYDIHFNHWDSGFTIYGTETNRLYNIRESNFTKEEKHKIKMARKFSPGYIFGIEKTNFVTDPELLEVIILRDRLATIHNKALERQNSCKKTDLEPKEYMNKYYRIKTEAQNVQS